MGRPASTIDWVAEETGVRRALDAATADSAFRIRSPHSASGDVDDEPTREYLRSPSTAPVSPLVELDRATSRAVARLRALIDCVAEEDPTSPVVRFVRAFLADVAELGEAIDALAASAHAIGSPPLDHAVDAFARAAATWRANLVEHVDDLALGDRRSLEGWSSLPEYSVMCTLALVSPALEPVKEWTCAARAVATELYPRVCEAEAAIVRLNWTLRSASSADAVGDAARVEPSIRAFVW